MRFEFEYTGLRVRDLDAAIDFFTKVLDDFDAALRRLEAAGYKPALGPFHEGVWHIAFVPVVEGIWLDVYHVDAPKQAKRKRPKRTGKRRKR